jgi:hypothetical protein
VSGSTNNGERVLSKPRSRREIFFALILVFALFEVVAHALTRARVPSDNEWRQAAAYVRANYREHDAITVAPVWADPILRWMLGDRIALSDAGRSDLDAYKRLWALAIRAARPAEAPLREPDFKQRFGRVELLRWDLPLSDVLYDLTEEIKNAEVTIVRGGVENRCPLLRSGPSTGGGLGQGALAPQERFVCDSARPWLWVAPVVIEDLDLKPRYCIWQHPAGQEPIRVTFRNAPLGKRIRFYAGLYYEHERYRKGGPVHAVIRVNGEKVAEMVHRDGEGYKALTAATQKSTDDRTTGDIAIEVTAPRTHKRSFCWAASVRGNAQERKRR